ncbi:hypothetical protein ACFSYG_05195 [Leeuwenhoekiella polynyae]|uniref:Lipoprotein n=1 Tax=Leeuwenhoekiella polynyae TaxID=1550906 RepID=A0A4Q0P0Y9_9FLAO|nr:hypothetical protein [Leeuwenhoekiella polynyae]RXG20143.1 hypothetical protein DSM02_2795 [Leeuwenhoekiella polynyae]|eukprot:TRINITY_DN44307_c0_g1_i1.p1 TRINITY_DN44307_c0_g1~~TRINITY_DN44307_c0_g1_i1.p1  ORF type:complete len:200 (-),score=5.81 TRINITY_DN44307_c0_g1_i1:37-636(-)
MKYIQIAAAGLLLATSLTSCKNAGEKEAQVEEDTKEVQTVKDSTAAEKARYAEAQLKTERPIMPEDYEINWDDVEADPTMKTDFEAWDDYRTFSGSLSDLELKKVPEAEITDYITQLEQEAMNLENTIPQSIMTEEIQEDIKDIKEEVADLKAITAQAGVNESKIASQVEELKEAYDDLNEEIKETVSNSQKRLFDDNQ